MKPFHQFFHHFATTSEEKVGVGLVTRRRVFTHHLWAETTTKSVVAIITSQAREREFSMYTNRSKSSNVL